MWIEPNDKTIFNSHSEIRSYFKNKSLPSHLDEDLISSLGVSTIVTESVPDYDDTKETVEKTDPIFENGQWIIKYNTVPLSKKEQESVIETKRDKMFLSRYDFKTVLRMKDLRVKSEEFISQTTDEGFIDVWNDAENIRRNSSFMKALAEYLELTETEVDDIFTVLNP